VRGGVDVAPVLGSRSTDLLSGLGPAVLAAGTAIPIGHPRLPHPGVDLAPVPDIEVEATLRITVGPRDDWFTKEALSLLTSRPYDVTPASDRVGLRLSGPALDRRMRGELPSEGMVEGALQVPPDGQPVLFLADHPVTGGYPVVAVVEPADVPLAGQARPGEQLRFTLGRRRA
jgi:allophanate hydrolase subunit 2